MFDPSGWGFGIGEALSGVIGALFSLLVLLVVVALIFLLVRFLLIGTKAAQLYLANHERQQRTVPPVASTEPQQRTQPVAAAERQQRTKPVATTETTAETAPTQTLPRSKPGTKPRA